MNQTHAAFMRLLVPLAAAAVLGAACGGIPNSSYERRTADNAGGAPVDSTAAFSVESVRTYLRQLAPYFVSRELTAEELSLVEERRFEAVAPILEEWTKEELFPRAARRLISQKLSVSGTRDDIDFDLPGNLAEFVVRQGLPFTTLLTADYCVDDKGEKRECDTGAPFNAGVLGTRAFMASRASRFNLTRASTMLRTFACRHYPMSSALEPRLPRERLIPLFQVDQQEESGEGEMFGNGSACYSCHGQFGPHAQLFVRFDESGIYRPEATGLQDPDGELGRSRDSLFTSHLSEPEEAKSDESQMFGKAVANLGEAAKVLAESETFASCQVENLLEYALRIPATVELDREVVAEIERNAGEAPSFASLFLATFSHPRIVSAVVAGVEGTGETP